MEEIIFRKAEENELPELILLQGKVFLEEQGIPMDEVDEFLKRKPWFWCAVRGKEYIATAASWKEEGLTHWGRFTVSRNCRGQHIGRKLACLSFDDLFENGIDCIHMEARDTTKNLVLSLGGEVTGESELFYGSDVTPLILIKENYHH